MEELILKTFAQSTSKYFETIAGSPAQVLPAYLQEADEPVALGYSAVIGISGSHKGTVFYTARREMVDQLLPHIGEKSSEHLLRADLVGEIANTISGNARELLGSHFMISTPLILEGGAYEVSAHRAAQSYVIPVEWSGLSSAN